MVRREWRLVKGERGKSGSSFYKKDTKMWTGGGSENKKPN